MWSYLQAPLNVVNSFREYLKDCYRCKPATYPGQEDCEPLQDVTIIFFESNLVFKKSDHNGDSKSLEIDDLCKLDDKTVVLAG